MKRRHLSNFSLRKIELALILGGVILTWIAGRWELHSQRVVYIRPEGHFRDKNNKYCLYE